MHINLLILVKMLLRRSLLRRHLKAFRFQSLPDAALVHWFAEVLSLLWFKFVRHTPVLGTRILTWYLYCQPYRIPFFHSIPSLVDSSDVWQKHRLKRSLNDWLSIFMFSNATPIHIGLAENILCLIILLPWAQRKGLRFEWGSEGLGTLESAGSIKVICDH